LVGLVSGRACLRGAITEWQPDLPDRGSGFQVAVK
jgi:hypothetical protein